MQFSIAQTYLSDVLHAVSQALLAPDIILLLAFIVYALFSVGSVISEHFTERRHFKVVMPKFLAALMAAEETDIPKVIAESGLLKRQKAALNTVYEYRELPGDALIALVKRLVSEEETRYDRIVGRNNMAAKVSPMLGLMGTLIPLGPGIQALGQADTAALSSSLLVAFDTTVAGLVTAAVCLVVGKIRSNWYNDYLSALDAAMATMLEKIEAGRAPAQAQEPEYSSWWLDDRRAQKEQQTRQAKQDATSRRARQAEQDTQDRSVRQESARQSRSAARAAEPAREAASAHKVEAAPTSTRASEPAPASESAPAPTPDSTGYSFLFDRKDTPAPEEPARTKSRIRSSSVLFEPLKDPLSDDQSPR